MLASTTNLLQMCSFDATKSTKGASKLRRDLINSEIANLRDLLPLPSSTRQRLSQLQLMALVCVYVRKANYFQHAFRKHELIPQMPMTNFGFSKALNGFLMMMTQNGKLLYISDNAAEYLGHSMEDLLIHGDSVYDIIEKQDHQTIQNELLRANNPLNAPNDTRIFLCRMNVSRNSRRQMRFGDQKVVLVQGHFVSYLPLCSRNEPVFLATCTPVAMPETRECVVQGSTNVFTSIHSMDMKFIHLDSNGEFHLGYNKRQTKNLSWYDIVHWEYLKEVQSKHRLITQSEQERSCILLLRLQTASMNWIWVHCVLQVKDNNENSQQPVIVCTNQVLSDKEAAVMQSNSWLYQFYSLHSKMHYAMQNTSSSGNGAPVASPSSSNAASRVETPTTSTTTPASPSYEQPSTSTAPTTPTPSSTRGSTGYTSQYSSNSSFSSSQQPFHSTETSPALALHPSHPNMSSYYSGANSGMSVSVNTPTSVHQYGQYGHSHPSTMQQYSPQAGTLPYAASTGQTGLTTPSTPPATSQTDPRIKEEIPAPRSKRSRNQDHEEKRSKKKHSASAAAAAAATSSSTSQENSFSNGSISHSGYSAGGYSAYHGSMFSATGFSSADLSMVPSYYGGSMSYHHSQLAYPHHFQGKFPFFDHGTATGSSLAGGSSVDPRSRPTNREEGMLVSFSGSTVPQPLSKSKPYPTESASDRRELDKVRSPESITSATSDYGSMTSQSPPSTFEKPSFTSLPSATNDLFDYSNSQHYQHSLKNNWYSEKQTESDSLSSSLHFSRLSSFQFWPGYGSSLPTEHDASHQHSHLPVASTFPMDSLNYPTGNPLFSYPANPNGTYDSSKSSLVNRRKSDTSGSSSSTSGAKLLSNESSKPTAAQPSI